MLENLKRFREPIAWVLLAVILAELTLGVVRLVLALLSGGTTVFAAFASIAGSAMNLTLVVALVAIVCVCLFIAPATPRAVRLTQASAWVITIGTLITLVATLVGLTAVPGVLGIIFELLGAVFDIVMKAVAAGVLWVIYRATKAGRMQPEDMREDPPAIEEPAPPVWKPTEASGSVWRTAAEAASGQAPSQRPASESGWKRVEPGRPEPDASPRKGDTPS